MQMGPARHRQADRGVQVLRAAQDRMHRHQAVAYDLPLPVRIMALADTFDAMTSARPYREPLSLGGALSDLVRMAPQKYDPNVVQALLIQVRRDAVGSNRVPLLVDHMAANISPTDVDQLAATLQHKVSHGKIYIS